MKLWPKPTPARAGTGSAEPFSAEYHRFNRWRAVRVAYLVTALISFTLSMMSSDTLFIASSGLILGMALLSALIAASRESKLASPQGDQ
jgi:hypothetical protein